MRKINNTQCKRMKILKKGSKINTIKFPNISTKIALPLYCGNVRKPVKKKLLT